MPEPPPPRRPPPPPAFEVVDDAPAPPPAFEVVDDTAVTAAGKTDTPRTPVRARDDADRPRKKKPKKVRPTAEEEAEELRARRMREFEYVWPAVLLVLGMAMTFGGALKGGGMHGFLVIGIMVVGMFVSIPVTIFTLMVVGMVVGINYGRFWPAVLKIAAITFVVNGVYFLGSGFKLPIFVVGPVGCVVAFGLFKALFDLDTAETNTSMGALNALSFATKFVILLIVAAGEAKMDRRPGPDPGDDDPVPVKARRGPNTPPPVADPGDDDDP